MNSLSPSYVPEAALEAWRSLYATDRTGAQQHYFDAILPGVIEYLQTLPVHRELRELRCSTLVSLMGFSPETTVIATALLRPQRVLILHSEATPESVNLAGKFLTSRDIVSFIAFSHKSVNPTNPVDIYEKVAQAIERGDDKQHIIDVTGGKKVMSAMAAIAAAELDLPVCYINGDYDPHLRRPVPGTENLVLISPHGPLSARNLRERALDRYDAYDYPGATSAFRSSRNAQARGGHQEDFALALCQVYAAWVDLDRKTLSARLGDLEQMLSRADLRSIRTAIQGLSRHFDALQLVAEGESTAMLATFIELAHRYANRGRHDFACLLAYRSMESLLDIGMRRATHGKFNFKQPDYSMLGDTAEVEQRFVELSRGTGSHAIERLPARVGMLDGLLLLAIADAGLIKRIGGRRLFIKLGGWLRKEADKRNDSVLAHGMTNLDAGDFKRMAELMESLLKAVLDADHARVEALREDLLPCDLRQLMFI